MHWTDTAIFLSSRKHGENSAVARIFCQSHGLCHGVIRGAHGKRNRGVLQPGNVVSASWNGRLPEQLGNFTLELLTPHAAFFMDDALKLNALLSLCSLYEAALPERHAYPKLFEGFAGFLEHLQEDDNWLESYANLELTLLAESGFGLDLSRCAATGATEDLIYISPKSGRAVSREAGEPYKERLLKLPSFLLSPPPAGAERVQAFRVREGAAQHIRTPNRYGSHALIPNAKELRKNMTEAEKYLWYHLRAQRFDGYKFRRQHPITRYYIADFICLSHKLIIEVDGGQHNEQEEYDAQRTRTLEKEGYRVLRFWNNEVLGNIDSVLSAILETLERTLSPSPELEKTTSGCCFSQFSLPPIGGGDISAALTLSGHFIEHWLLESNGRKMPAARERFIILLRKSQNIVTETIVNI